MLFRGYTLRTEYERRERLGKWYSKILTIVSHSQKSNKGFPFFAGPNLRLSPRPISTGQLHTLLHFHLRPIYHIVYVGPYFFRMGDLILGGVSRLDAFSVYHFHTRLPGCAPGGTTDAPEVCPSRSFRTKDSSSQISCAHDR